MTGSEPGFFGKWWISSRPFSFPATIVPVMFGTIAALSVSEVRLNFIAAILALIGMILLHSAANIFSDAYDFKLGLDKEVLPVSGGVVRGFMTPSVAIRAALLLSLAGSIIGIYLAFSRSIDLLWIGAVGLGVGLSYPLLKRLALGDFAVFLNFALLGSLGSWTVQTTIPSILPVIWAVPLGFLVIAILHANNWRDSLSDKNAGLMTVASILGERGSLYYYLFLIFCPFLLVVLFVFLPISYQTLPSYSILVFLSLPIACHNAKKAMSRGEAFAVLDGSTAQLSMIFGVLLCLGLIIDVIR